ncbi:UDP-N-acetylglucosamine 2-epimerase (non-hydrolyzing) [Verrucomicrobia bacterium]|nr:UDP-N-acetylglucosamine 2-epimerase (non-hydrolyzing) [Verrucomicrobiota bacterium]
MKIVTIFGTRPEIIRLSVIIPELDKHAEQILVHTGQNYDPNLSDVFLNELGIRKLDFHLGIRSSTFGEQAGEILTKTEELLIREKPDKLLILGDTNSGLAAIVASRLGIPVYHLEAGNRCYDNRVPEEVNRRIIDHSSDILLPYTQRSAANLVQEGIRRERIYVVGNPILEVIEHFMPKIEASQVLQRLGLKPQSYFLATMHRAENVDPPSRLKTLFEGLDNLSKKFGKPVILSAHPRTTDRLLKLGLEVNTNRIRLEKPFGLFDFVHLEKSAAGVVTDSGTVQEEACIFGIPNVTIRDVTERPETIECGSNIIVGADPTLLTRSMELSLNSRGNWNAPPEYTMRNVASTVARVLLSYR